MKAIFAVLPLLYIILIPRSRLSSEELSPISIIGSLTVITVELNVVVVPDTDKSPVTDKFLVTSKSLPIVTSCGNPTVTVPFERETSVSLAVPAIARTAPVVASLSDTAPELTSKSPLSNDATPFTLAVAGAIVKSCVLLSPVEILTLLFDEVYATLEIPATATSDAAVILPLASTVIIGTSVAEPYSCAVSPEIVSNCAEVIEPFVILASKFAPDCVVILNLLFVAS